MLLLVDGSSYLYRAFHAGGDWRVTLPDGSRQPTGALRIMVNMMQSLTKEYPAIWAACVFDAKGETFRHALYADYKGHRPPMPDDLRSQLDPIHELVRLQGWKVLAIEGVEADDVIGTLAKAAAAQGIDVIISSGDKDLSQLVDAHITVIDTMNGKRRDAAGVEGEFGVPPAQMIDFQTLVGDATDNVPGVHKVGPKTAAKWLQQYGSLDALVADAANIKGAAGENLRQALDWLPVGKQLVTIKTDCDLSGHVDGLPQLQALTKQPADTAALRDFYQRYQFNSLLKKLDADAAQGGNPNRTPLLPGFATDVATPAASPALTAPVHYTTVTSWEVFDDWLARITQAGLTALDTETTSLNAMQAQIVGLSLCVTPGQAAYIPLAHNGADAPEQLPLQQVLEKLRPWLEDASKRKLGQHIKYDSHVFANHGLTVQGYVHDTMLQSYVLEAHKPHNLESLMQRHLGKSGLSYEDLCGKGASQIPFSQVAVEQAAPYACEDANYCLQVHQVLWPQITASPALLHIYELEMATSAVLLCMERTGVAIDARQLAVQGNELGKRMLALEQEAHALAGQRFNLGSPKQIGEIFFTQLGLPVLKKTASGAPSTDEEVLEKLAEDFALPRAILEYRSLAKLKNTYTDKLPGMADPVTGRVHTNYAQAVAVTGRLASNEPNLQNIPVRTAEGRRIREAFVAAPGHVIASADYSQIELRIMAHISEDPALIRAFETGMDVHRATAAEVFGVAPDQVDSEQRRYAKVINFGLIYGMSSFGLAKALGIDNTAARNYIQRYFERYPGVQAYMERARQQAREQGYVETVFGRRLYLPDINSPNGPRRNGAERAAINAPMQGTAADLIKMSMVEVLRTLNAQQRATRMIMQVHDELVFEAPLSEADWVRVEIPRIMASVAQLRVPLLAEIGVGDSWEKAH
ncbi:MAG: DNA polymerase I [Brachymonas sp.]|nr:DNA polymerase I [Brachymonas sp.]MBP8820864.1 DNA polymerase I [Brachymonas sp.]